MFSLDELVDYECRTSERYRRIVSLLVLGIQGGETCFFQRAGDLVRDSDQVVGLDDAVAIIMGETPVSGALHAVARFATRYGNGDGTGLQCGAAVFPEDARNAGDLQRIALRRFEAAKSQGGNAFVWKD